MARPLLKHPCPYYEARYCFWQCHNVLPLLTAICMYRDFPAIRKHMGQSRTLGAVRSYFSKNRKRLDFDRIAEEAQARGGAEALPMQQVCTCHGQALPNNSQIADPVLAIHTPNAASAWTSIEEAQAGIGTDAFPSSRWCLLYFVCMRDAMMSCRYASAVREP